MTKQVFALSKTSGAALFCAAFLNVASVSADDEVKGKALYEENCAVCHQFDGGGVPFQQPELIESKRANGPKGGVIEMILKGSAAVPAGTSEYNNEMPSFDYLSNEDIALIASYVRTHFENKGGKVTPGDVAGKRSK